MERQGTIPIKQTAAAASGLSSSSCLARSWSFVVLGCCSWASVGWVGEGEGAGCC